MKEDALDEILENIGDFGKHQKIAYFLICVVVIFTAATHMAYVFTAMDSEYRCLVPTCDYPDSESNPFQPDWIRNAIPLTPSNESSKCDMYAPVHNYSFQFDYRKCSVEQFDKEQIRKCDSHVFKDDEYYIGREYNLLCEDNLWKLSLVGTINTVGYFFGLFISGIVSDRHGRKIVLLFGIALCGSTGIVKSFSPSFEWFCVMEFLDALCSAGCYGSAFILGVELVVPKNRAWTSCVLFICCAIGEVYIAAVAWAVRDWRWILYFIYGPSMLLIFFYWFIPESVRWHLGKREIEKPKGILRKFAAANGKTIPESFFYGLKRTVIEREEKRETISVIEIVKSIPLLFRLINCCFLWTSCALLFYGLTLNSVTLAGNSYLDFILISLTEIPAYWIISVVAEKLGRKFSLCGSYFITSASCLAFVLVDASEWIHLLLYCLGKFGATSAFSVIYMMTSEIFPTPLRHTTMNICSMVGRIGTVISPQVPLLGLLWHPLPLVIFASVAVLSEIVTLLLPETLNLKLPDTVTEAEKIGAGTQPLVNPSNAMKT